MWESELSSVGQEANQFQVWDSVFGLAAQRPQGKASGEPPRLCASNREKVVLLNKCVPILRTKVLDLNSLGHFIIAKCSAAYMFVRK